MESLAKIEYEIGVQNFKKSMKGPYSLDRITGKLLTKVMQCNQQHNNT